MQSVKNTLALATLLGLAALASCTLITDVDRSKIPISDPSDAGDSNGGGNNGGGSGSGGSTAGEAGTRGEEMPAAGSPGNSDDTGVAGSTP